MVRAAARDDDGVGDEVQLAADEIAPNRWEAGERARVRARVVAGAGRAVAKVAKKLGECGFARAEEHSIGVRGGLVWQAGDVKTPEHDEAAAAPECICEVIAACGAGDVGLNDNEVGVLVAFCVGVDGGLDVLVDDADIIFG